MAALPADVLRGAGVTYRIIHGDCREAMAAMDADSIDAIVCDPPYGLEFMGKGWDHGVPGVEFWTAALRVLKPGGHLLAFGGTRTFHRLTCAIEDAGFEIRDCLSWMYGSGFPKSKNLDGDWQGWGTALKPAWEPIILARKPLGERNVAANVQRWGTGAVNVDGCRIGVGEIRRAAFTSLAPCHGNKLGAAGSAEARRGTQGEPKEYDGRWPANLVLDEAAAALLDEQTGELTSGANPTRRGADAGRMVLGAFGGQDRCDAPRGVDTGGASRFFYTSKASTAERGKGNTHPTVKPVDLMRWLCRLITPPGGTVLDPFCGSGSTGIAATREGFDFIGIEQAAEYVTIAKRRIYDDAPLLHAGVADLP